jgi:hypothetical protein
MENLPVSFTCGSDRCDVECKTGHSTGKKRVREQLALAKVKSRKSMNNDLITTILKLIYATQTPNPCTSYEFDMKCGVYLIIV